MITLILAHLRALSPSYRASRLALKIERNRRIGFARFHARKAMQRAAMIEEASGELDKTITFVRDGQVIHVGSEMAPGFLPATVWRALPLFGRTFRSL